MGQRVSIPASVPEAPQGDAARAGRFAGAGSVRGGCMCQVFNCVWLIWQCGDVALMGE